jgi:hypothetical protein
MNEGEKAELKFIATLATKIDSEVKLFNGKKFLIKKVEIPIKDSLLTIEKINENINPMQIDKLSEEELNIFCKKNKIKKAGAHSKADVYINSEPYSVKYTNSAPPAIVNHTNRLGWEFAANVKNISIDNLDKIIDEYWQKRIDGVIREDVANTESESPFAVNKKDLLPYLEYFSFEGTGSKLSNHKANAVIEFSNPCFEETWKIINKLDFIDSVWDRLVFSLRSKKGMPSDINSKRISEDERKSILKWSRDIDGNLKGALHIRVK